MSDFAKDINVPINDCISRQAAIDEAVAYMEEWNNAKSEYHKKEITKRFQNLPSAQPETDGFCADCKEYDQDRHFCPRFDRVIKTTIEEMGIIHCKDCKNADEHGCTLFCTFWTRYTVHKGYCFKAERREDG